MGDYSRDIYILGAVRTLRSFSFGYVAFLLPLYLKYVGFSYEMIGIYTLIATLSSAVLTLASGWLGDLYSRRKALAIMSLLPAGTYAIALSTRNYAALMASAAFGLTMNPIGGGSGGGPVAPLQTAMVASRVGPEARTKVYSYLMMAAIASALAGSAFSGAVMRASRGYYLELFSIALAITVGTSALVLLVSEEPDRAHRPASAVPRRSAKNIGKVSLAGLFGSLGLGMLTSSPP
ncbi:MFS transporter [Acidilobus sp.]|uniref:MFS transporter n=1 Tax=Acidilobus sp. TaxID=1872109 RepID=UPI003D0430F5